MKLTLENTTDVPVPVLSDDGKYTNLVKGSPLQIDWYDASVIVLGDKPTVSDQFMEAAGVLAKSALELLRLRKKDPKATNAFLKVTIKSNDSNIQRIVLGDGVTDHQLMPGESYNAVSADYIEVRQMGEVPAPPPTDSVIG